MQKVVNIEERKERKAVSTNDNELPFSEFCVLPCLLASNTKVPFEECWYKDKQNNNFNIYKSPVKSSNTCLSKLQHFSLEGILCLDCDWSIQEGIKGQDEVTPSFWTSIQSSSFVDNEHEVLSTLSTSIRNNKMEPYYSLFHHYYLQELSLPTG